MEVALDALSWLLLGLGSFFCMVGGLGLLRLPDVYTRTHGAAITDTLGAGLILIGLMLQAGPTLVTVKLVLVLAFLLFTSPVSGHALVKAAFSSGVAAQVEHSDVGHGETAPGTDPKPEHETES
ncbi:MAG: monovalent cation/H(+) antiporter subunit G [Myxococcales bacterium]|nr:monovalent cation/H(+) antiporter subunit G [Myxococcales bacterium]